MGHQFKLFSAYNPKSFWNILQDWGVNKSHIYHIVVITLMFLKFLYPLYYFTLMSMLHAKWPNWCLWQLWTCFQYLCWVAQDPGCACTEPQHGGLLLSHSLSQELPLIRDPTCWELSQGACLTAWRHCWWSYHCQALPHLCWLRGPGYITAN